MMLMPKSSSKELKGSKELGKGASHAIIRRGVGLGRGKHEKYSPE
jgi:hypothetical protein